MAKGTKLCEACRGNPVICEGVRFCLACLVNGVPNSIVYHRSATACDQGMLRWGPQAVRAYALRAAVT